jgi:serine phosphatase RsbU (regulator of sigma subunit)
MDFAQEMQQHFLPAVPPESQGYRFWAYYSAAGKVGGDYYDFIRLPDGRQAVLLGDVAGKGVPAALMMAKLSAVCKVALLSFPDSVSRAVAAVNSEICQVSLHSAFVTLVMCVIDPRSHRITFANAGHLAPVVRRIDGSVEELTDDIRGYPLGVFADAEYRTTSTVLAAGESVILYSDGISEATNSRDEMYTGERVCEQFAEMREGHPSDIGESLLRDVRRHTGDSEQSDDISLLVFQRA